MDDGGPLMYVNGFLGHKDADVDKAGETPLQAATRFGHRAVEELLTRHAIGKSAAKLLF